MDLVLEAPYKYDIALNNKGITPINVLVAVRNGVNCSVLPTTDFSYNVPPLLFANRALTGVIVWAFSYSIKN